MEYTVKDYKKLKTVTVSMSTLLFYTANPQSKYRWVLIFIQKNVILSNIKDSGFPVIEYHTLHT